MHESTAKGCGVCVPSTPKRAVRLAYLFGDGCACSHMQVDDSMNDASLTRKGTAANLTRWRDHEEAVIARASAPLVTPSKLTSQRALSVSRHKRNGNGAGSAGQPRQLSPESSIMRGNRICSTFDLVQIGCKSGNTGT